MSEISVFTKFLIENGYKTPKIVKELFDRLKIKFEIQEKSEGVYQIYDLNKNPLSEIDFASLIKLYFDRDFAELTIFGLNDKFYVFFSQGNADSFFETYNKFMNSKNDDRYRDNLSSISKKEFGISLVDLVNLQGLDRLKKIKSPIYFKESYRMSTSGKDRVPLKSTILRKTQKSQRWEKKIELSRRRRGYQKTLRIIKETSKVRNLGLTNIHFLNPIDIVNLIEIFNIDKNLFRDYYTLTRMIKRILKFEKLFDKNTYLKEYFVFFLTRKSSRYDRLEIKGSVYLSRYQTSVRVIYINLRTPLHFENTRTPNEDEFNERKMLNDNDHQSLWQTILSFTLIKDYDVIMDPLKLDRYSTRYIDYLQSVDIFTPVFPSGHIVFHDWKIQKKIAERGFYLNINKEDAKSFKMSYMIKKYSLLDLLGTPIKYLQTYDDFKYILIDNSARIDGYNEESNPFKEYSSLKDMHEDTFNKFYDHTIDTVDDLLSGSINFLLVYKNINDFIVYTFYIYKEIYLSEERFLINFMYTDIRKRKIEEESEEEDSTKKKFTFIPTDQMEVEEDEDGEMIQQDNPISNLSSLFSFGTNTDKIEEEGEVEDDDTPIVGFSFTPTDRMVESDYDSSSSSSSSSSDSDSDESSLGFFTDYFEKGKDQFRVFLKYIYDFNIFEQKKLKVTFENLEFIIDYEYIKEMDIMFNGVEEIEIPKDLGVIHKYKINMEYLKAYYISNRGIDYIINRTKIFQVENLYSSFVEKIKKRKYCPFGYYNIILLYDKHLNEIISTKTYKEWKVFVSRIDRMLYTLNTEHRNPIYSPDITEIKYIKSMGTNTLIKFRRKGFASLIVKLFEMKMIKQGIFWISLFSVSTAAKFWLGHGVVPFQKKQDWKGGSTLKNLYDTYVDKDRIYFEESVLTRYINRVGYIK